MAEKKKISAKEILADVKAGMTDQELMDKYQLSSSGLQSLFRKMIGANLLTEYDLDQRAPPLPKTPETPPPIRKATGQSGGPHFECGACGFSQNEPFNECPKCGIVYGKRHVQKEPAPEPSETRWDISIGGIIGGIVCLVIAFWCLHFIADITGYDHVTIYEGGTPKRTVSIIDYGKPYVIFGTLCFIAGVIAIAMSLGFRDLRRLSYWVVALGGGLALLTKQVLVFCLLALIALVLWVAGRVREDFQEYAENHDEEWD